MHFGASFGLNRKVRTCAVVCTQWGDSGKGKFGDIGSKDWADITARGTGGGNAGHTIRVGNQDIVLHLVPAGILHDGPGKMSVIGRGVACDPGALLAEIEALHQAGFATNHLRLSFRAHLVLPQHLLLDRLRERCTGKIGTTGKGIGPLYADHPARIGMTVNDLLNRDFFVEKFRRNLAAVLHLLRGLREDAFTDARQKGKEIDDPVREIMHHRDLGGGIFYDEKNLLNIDAITEQYLGYGKQFKPYIADTEGILQSEVGKKNILLEGSQGNLLSINHGTYPYVTSSDCTVEGLAAGVGLTLRDVDFAYGVVKAPYMTRVGDGPFPTEMGGAQSAEWCASKVTANDERERWPNVDVNATDPFEQGVAIRMAGKEYGATTGRPRRVGWLDLPLLRYSVRNLDALILTKVDVLDFAREINICDAHVYEGPPYTRGASLMHTGITFTTALPEVEALRHSRPHYLKYRGWMTSTRDYYCEHERLPDQLEKIIRLIEGGMGLPVRIVSFGADAKDTMLRYSPLI